MIKKLIILLTLIIAIQNIFSSTVVSSCMEINETIMPPDRTFILNQNLNQTKTECIHIRTSNFKFDCNNYMINTSGYTETFSNYYFPPPFYVSNITIKNCLFEGGYKNIFIDGSPSENSSFINLTFYNSQGAIYLKESGVDRNIFENIYIYNNSWFAITIEDGDNNYFNNINIISSESTSIGFYITESAYNNTIVNSNIETRSNNLRFDFSGGTDQKNNTFYNNIFSNISSIYSTDWSKTPTNFSFNGWGNTYKSNFTLSGKYCFDEPNNLSCDYFANIELFPEISQTSNNQSSSTMFPSLSLISLIVIFLIVILKLNY